jgi:hypothetical protein
VQRHDGDLGGVLSAVVLHDEGHVLEEALQVGEAFHRAGEFGEVLEAAGGFGGTVRLEHGDVARLLQNDLRELVVGGCGGHGAPAGEVGDERRELAAGRGARARRSR